MRKTTAILLILLFLTACGSETAVAETTVPEIAAVETTIAETEAPATEPATAPTEPEATE